MIGSWAVCFGGFLLQRTLQLQEDSSNFLNLLGVANNHVTKLCGLSLQAPFLGYSRSRRFQFVHYRDFALSFHCFPLLSSAFLLFAFKIH
jgi:hypothetical protein